MTLLIELVVV